MDTGEGQMVELVGYVGEHLILAYGSLAISVFLGISLAIVALRSPRLASLLLGIANFGQAVPSFAVVAIVVPLLGIGFTPAILAILARSLLPIMKNTYIGLSEVDPAIIDSARGIGLTDLQTLAHVRFPHAYGAIFAGVKFSAVLVNSVAILTATIGSGGLGEIVFEGLAGFNMELMLSGVVPAMLIAIATDALLSFIEKRLLSG